MKTEDGKFRRNRIDIRHNDEKELIHLYDDDDNSNDGAETMQKQGAAKLRNVANEEIYNENDGNNEDENDDDKTVRTQSGRIVKRPNYLKDHI